MGKYSSASGKKAHRNTARHTLLVAFGVLALSGVLFTILELTDRTFFLHNRKATSGVIPSTQTGSQNPTTTTSRDKNGIVASTDQPTPPEDPKLGDASPSPAPPGSAPITPFGNFISNHSPNLSGSPSPNSIESVCNTSPGAKCRIEFTNVEGIVKTLEDRVTDVNGAAFWTWNIKQAGFTVGAWKVRVIATLNGQVADIYDAQNMEVRP